MVAEWHNRQSDSENVRLRQQLTTNQEHKMVRIGHCGSIDNHLISNSTLRHYII